MKFNDKPLVLGATLMMVVYSVYKANRFSEIKELLNVRWLINFALMIAFGVYITSASDGDSKVKEALKKAVLAFIIAVLAHLRMTIAPFWIVFVLAYYLEGWV